MLVTVRRGVGWDGGGDSGGGDGGGGDGGSRLRQWWRRPVVASVVMVWRRFYGLVEKRQKALV